MGKTRDELEMMVHALENDLERLQEEHSWLNRCAKMQKEQLTLLGERVIELTARVVTMKASTFAAIGSLHVINSCANTVTNYRGRFIDHPAELTAEVATILAHKKITHEALTEDYRAEDAKTRLAHG